MANSYEGVLGWSVGRFEWLDSESSKVNRYWRAIEMGSMYWVGKHIVGLWGDRPGDNSRPNILRSGTLDAMRSGVGSQKFVPFFATEGANMEKAARAALLYYLGIQMHSRPTDEQLARLNGATPQDNRNIFFWLMTRAPADRFPFVSTVVGRPIEARNFYRQALVNYDPMTEHVALLRRGVSLTLSGMSSTGTEARGPDQLKPGMSGPTRGGVATLRTSVATQSFLRNDKGQFTSWQDMIVDINKEMASQFQAAVVEMMTSSKGHRVPTGDLLRATEDPRNRTPA